jgi:predicted transcriptional regulator
MDILWQSDGFTVREVHLEFARPLAYTTVMTTLDRLYKKGFVSRTRSGRAFVYRASRTRAQTEEAVTSGMLHGLLSSGAAMPILSNLVDVVGNREGGLELLEALEEIVREKRRQLNTGTQHEEE